MLTCDYWLRSIWVSVQFETLGAKERIEFDHVIDKGLDRFVCLVAEGGRRSLRTEDLWQNVSHAVVVEFSFFLDRFKWLRGRRPREPCHGLTPNRDQCSEIQEGLTLLFPYLIRAALPPALSFRESLLPASYHSAQ